MQTRVGPGRRRPAGPQHQRRQELARADRLDPAGDARHRPPRPGPHRAGPRTPAPTPAPARRRSPPRSRPCATACSAWPTGRSAGRPLFGGVTAGTKAYDADGTYVGLARAAGHPPGLRHRGRPRRHHRPGGLRTAPGPTSSPIVDKHRHGRRRQPGRPADAPRRPRRRHEGHADRARRRRRTGPRASSGRSRSTADRSLTLSSQLGGDREHRPAQHDHAAADAADRLRGGAVRHRQGALSRRCSTTCADVRRPVPGPAPRRLPA